MESREPVKADPASPRPNEVAGADLGFHCPDRDQLDSYVATLQGPIPDTAVRAVEAMVEDRLAPVNVEAPVPDILRVLAMAIRPQLAVEIGTLAGYSTSFIAAGMTSGSRLVTVERDPRTARIARRVLAGDDSGPDIEVLEGSALEVLNAHIGPGSADLMLIDGSKAEYPEYLKLAHRLLRIGGLLIADDTFAFGRVAQADLSEGFERAVATPIRTFNHIIFHSPLFSSAMLPTRQGLSLSVKTG